MTDSILPKSISTSHSSAIPDWHTTAPFTQAVVPGLQGGAAPVGGNMVPGSGVSGVQGEPPTTPTRGSTRFSSVMPLQLSSMPLHTSGLGPTVCTQVSPFGPGPGLGATHWNTLPAEVRKALEDTAKETQAYVYQVAAKDDEELLGKLKQAGMQVNEVDKEAFIAASKPIYEEFGKEVPGAKDLIERAVALGK